MAEDGTALIEELMRFKPDGLTPNAWAVQAGVGRTIWTDLRRHGNPSRRTLSRLLEAAGSSLAEFEALRVGHAAGTANPAGALGEPKRDWASAPLAPLTVFESGLGGHLARGEQGIQLITINRDVVIDRLARPPTLAADRDAYALEVTTDAMWPRFRLGRRVAISPAAPLAVGDDVFVILEDERALLAELRLKGPNTLVLRQFNPPVEFDVPAAEVEAVHKVLGELI